MDKNSVYRTNIIGAGEVGSAISVDMDKNVIHETNSLFWDTKGNDILEQPHFLYMEHSSQKKNASFLAIFQEKDVGDRLWKRSIIAISRERKASELWGMDISENQIEKQENICQITDFQQN